MAGIANELKKEAAAHTHVFNQPKEKRTDRFMSKIFQQFAQDAWDDYYNLTGFERSDTLYNFHRLEVYDAQDFNDFMASV